MTSFIIALLIGTVAGIIDVIPMRIRKLDNYTCLSAFLHWVVMGVVIAYVQLPMAPWIKGIVLAELSALPVIALVAKDDKKAILPILIMSAILGALVGLAAAKWVVV